MKTTQSVIAMEVGVSQAMVSKVLNGETGKVSAETRHAIIKTARKLGYNRNVTEVRKCIGILINSMEDLSRPSIYLLKQLSGIQNEAHARKLTPLTHLLGNVDELDVLSDQVMGWIVLGPLSIDQIERLQQSGPVVFLHYDDISGQCSRVQEDNRTAVRQVIAALYEQGHRRFGYFNIRPMGITQAENYGAFMQALIELDLPIPPPEWIVTPHRQACTAADVERLIRQYLGELQQMARRPTALFIAADIYALPFLRLAPEYGFAIPRDFSVIGYDDISEAALATPSLSSIAQPLAEMGQEAVARLDELINNPRLPPRGFEVRMTVKFRDSVGPAPTDN